MSKRKGCLYLDPETGATVLDPNVPTVSKPRRKSSVWNVREATYVADHDEGVGICLACGDLNQGEGGWCEPDARGYACMNCGAKRLMGLSEALIAGRINLT